MEKLEGSLLAAGLRITILVSRFNYFITEKLVTGAMETYVRLGGQKADLRLVYVPGAFELPLAARKWADKERPDAMVALSAVVRGDTPHFDHVCRAATSGISSVSLQTGIPIGFGVLTTDTAEQAMDRAGFKSGNKGSEAMESAVEMANLLKEIR